MIDTHSHILPGLDDGSPDLESSLRMARVCARSGVRTIVCTPHLLELDLAFITEVEQTRNWFQNELEARGIGLQLLLGFEVDCELAATASLDDLGRLMIEGTNLLLVEVPHWGWPLYLRDNVFRLSSAGYVPILAHPERNDHIQKNPHSLAECVSSGAYAQATIGSLSGMFGRETKQAFLRHLAQGQVSMIASDAHFSRRSSWSLAYVSKVLPHLDKMDVQQLTDGNPRLLLSGSHPRVVRCAQPSRWRRLTDRG